MGTSSSSLASNGRAEGKLTSSSSKLKSTKNYESKRSSADNHPNPLRADSRERQGVAAVRRDESRSSSQVDLSRFNADDSVHSSAARRNELALFNETLLDSSAPFMTTIGGDGTLDTETLSGRWVNPSGQYPGAEFGVVAAPVRFHCPLGCGSGRFKHGRPPSLLGGEEIFPCFEEGLFYRIVSADGCTWRVYNDTVEYVMLATYTFGQGSQLTPLGRTKTERLADGRIQATASVYPGETMLYVTGAWSSFSSEVEVEALPASWVAKKQSEGEEFLESDMEAICALLKKKDRKPYNIVNTAESQEGRRRYARFDNVGDEELLKWCVAANIAFVDTTFPPDNFAAIMLPSKDLRGLCAWMRPTVALTSPLSELVALFRDNLVYPMNISMSGLGNDWLMSAIAALAEEDFYVRLMFQHPTDSKALTKEHALGGYRVTLNRNGWWESVIVDDYLPYVGSTPKFGKVVNDPCEMWVSILEKAYAKIHKNYAAIATGDPLRALQDMTGFPTTRYDSIMEEARTQPAKIHALFESVERFVSLGFIVVLDQVKAHYDVDVYHRLGLRPGSCYRVTGFCRISPTNGILRIRNIWGRGGDWTGNWGRMSDSWSRFPDVTEGCGYTGEEDGTFWMSWSDVLACFFGFGVCFTHSNFHEYRVRCGFDGPASDTAVRIEVTQPAFLVASLTQLQSQPNDGKQERRVPCQCKSEGGISEWLPIGLSLFRNTEVEFVRKGSVPSSGGEVESDAVSSKETARSKGSTAFRQVAHVHATADTDRPRKELILSASRDLSFVCELDPRYSPYYVVPRITREWSGKELDGRVDSVLTLLTSIPLVHSKDRPSSSSSKETKSKASVEPLECATAKLVRLPPKTEIFTSNGTLFATKDESKVTREFQYRVPGGTEYPKQSKGSQLVCL